MGLTALRQARGSPAVHELADAQPDQPTVTAERMPRRGLLGDDDSPGPKARQQEQVGVGKRPLLPGHPRRQAVQIIQNVRSCPGLRLFPGRFGSPVGRAALELLPVAAVRVLGMLACHPLGKFGVERVGEGGDVA